MKLSLIFTILFFFTGLDFCQAQSYDVYIDNRRLTSDTTLEFDVYIKNTGSTTSWSIRSYQAGYRIASAFVNGGTITGSYVPGTTELESTFNPLWGFSWSNANKVVNQSSNTGSSCPGGLISRIPKKIGRFRLKNSVSWGCGADSLALVTTGTGYLKLAITKYNFSDCSVATATDITSFANPYTKPTVHSFEINTCGSYTWYGTSYSASGTYTHTDSIPTGCTPITDTLFLTIQTTNVWNGNVSSAWEDPLNWGCGTVPDSNSIVSIDPSALNFPIIQSIAWCKKIFIGAGATLRVNPGFKLNVTGKD